MELALAATVSDCRKHGLRVTTLTARNTRNRNTRNQERNFVLVGHRVSGNLFEFFRMRCTDHGTEVTEVGVPFHNLVSYRIEGFGNIAWIIATGHRQILEVVGALVTRAEQHISTVFRIFANERTHGISPHPRGNRHGVGLVHIVSGGCISGARLTDVTTLCIQNNGDACAAIISNQLLQHEHRLHAHAFVVSAVRLHHGGRHVTL